MDCHAFLQNARNDAVVGLSSLRGMSKANDEAIYNLTYRRFYNGIFKARFLIMDCHAFLQNARNDNDCKIMDCFVLAVFAMTTIARLWIALSLQFSQ